MFEAPGLPMRFIEPMVFVMVAGLFIGIALPGGPNVRVSILVFGKKMNKI